MAERRRRGETGVGMNLSLDSLILAEIFRTTRSHVVYFMNIELCRLDLTTPGQLDNALVALPTAHNSPNNPPYPHARSPKPFSHMRTRTHKR